jgi:hypothetical protein
MNYWEGQEFQSLEEWLHRYDYPALDPLDWAQRLWDAIWGSSDSVFTRDDITRSSDSLKDVDLPDSCWIAKGSPDELGSFQTNAIYIREDYLRILRQIISCVEVKNHSTSMDVDDNEPRGDAELQILNPFTTTREFKLGQAIILTGSPGIGML